MSAALFLSAEELAELTGRASSAGQRKWLKDNGYPFATNANKRPIVAREYLLNRLGVAATMSPHAMMAAVPRPNFGALKSA